MEETERQEKKKIVLVKYKAEKNDLNTKIP